MTNEEAIRYFTFRGNTYRSVINNFIRYLCNTENRDLARVLVANRKDAETKIAAFQG